MILKKKYNLATAISNQKNLVVNCDLNSYWIVVVTNWDSNKFYLYNLSIPKMNRWSHIVVHSWCILFKQQTQEK